MNRRDGYKDRIKVEKFLISTVFQLNLIQHMMN